jgi:hypothetical protein
MKKFAIVLAACAIAFVTLKADKCEWDVHNYGEPQQQQEEKD